ncbi:MAG: molecular chaperone HtpG [Chloroflexi bacterium]|nr:molecular chaperone HtpG [Chloroflexota bacterium]MBP8054884.1 molecular chaperone HtpG [Chloroflexota bacterium]
MTIGTTPQDYTFKAEIKQLLDILVHSLYKERDIFLRELISNASDALTRLHFESLTNQNIVDPSAELAIHVQVVTDEDEAKPKKIVLKDSGIGMTAEELMENLGTIAQSGAKAFLKKVKENDTNQVGEIIGQFGVGFYSVFMVASEVRVVSRSYRADADAAAWTSQGDATFHIEPADKSDRGTEVHITLRQDAEEYANEWKLNQIIKTHSDYVNFPIYVGEKQANQRESLWRKNPSDVSAEDYKKFYQQLTLDFEEPLATIHATADAPVNVRMLLFVPSKREKSILAARKEPGVKLYTHNVMIQEYCTDLLPKWLDFVDGVVDSEDLPLNVSRETVQNTRLMKQLAKTVRGRVLRELKRLADKEPEKYAQFWAEFSRTFKEGLATDFEAKEDILPLLRFYSSQSKEVLTSLDSYVERMGEGQEAIYYVLGDSLESVQFSPHLDPFKARNLEVLYLIDPLDPFMTPVLNEYKGKSLKNVDDAGLELPELKDAAADETPTEDALPDKLFNQLIGRCVTTLGDRVVEVRAAKVLKDSPVRLVSPENEANRDMQRIYRLLDKEFTIPKKILEVNRAHPIVTNLAQLVEEVPDSPIINLTIEQLYDSALVQEGLHPNPTAMLPRIQKLMELATSNSR